MWLRKPYICDIQMDTGQSLQLKEEQERAVRDLLLGRDLLAISCQQDLAKAEHRKPMYVQKNISITQWTQPYVVVITPLNSIAKGGNCVIWSNRISQLLMLQRYLQKTFTTAISKLDMQAQVVSKPFRVILMDSKSQLHQLNLVGLAADEKHTVETCTASLEHNVGKGLKR